jgi:DNA-binding FrmR family transcriptional regulator
MHRAEHEAISRLRLLSSQLTEISACLERPGSCPELLGQILAARQGLGATQRLLVQNRLRVCIEHIRQSGDEAAQLQALTEILQLYRCAAAN